MSLTAASDTRAPALQTTRDLLAKPAGPPEIGVDRSDRRLIILTGSSASSIN